MGVLDLDLLATLTPEERAEWIRSLPPDQFDRVREEAFQAMGVAGPYAFDPVGYVEEALREVLWSLQRRIIESVRDNVRTAVPACYSAGKSHLAARVVAWWLDSWPVGTAMAVTTATNFRSVKGQLWQHIRRVHRVHRLQGRCNLTEWWVGQEQIGLGFSAPDADPEAIQGWHAAHILVVVDEAGGISDAIGSALDGLISSGHARILAIGNPSIDQQDTWFERICKSPRWNVIRLDAYSTPNFTGEDPGPCRTCPRGAPPHTVGSHLTSRRWVEETIEDYGPDSPYVISRVNAKFPEVSTRRTLPFSWVEDATTVKPPPGFVVTLGVDVASDGGDELAIARREGYQVRLVRTESGRVLANDVDVAGIVLEEILAAEARAKEMGYGEKVRVKVDAIGQGHGVASILERWGDEQRHASEIVKVTVSERAREPEKFANQRAEMWWNLRDLIKPIPGQEPEWKLPDDRRAIAQLAAPDYGNTSDGRILIESKKSLRERGERSPDRAEAVLLALYEPPTKRRKVEIIA